MAAYLKVFEEKYKIVVRKGQIISWDLTKIEGVTEEICLDTFNEVFSNKELVKPYPGAIEAIKEYYDRVNKPIVIISHRFDKGIRGARTWCNEYLKKAGIEYELVISVPHKKIDKIIERKLAGFVEDNPETAMAVAEAGILSIIFDHRYNRSANHENMIRVYGWDALRKCMLLTGHKTCRVYEPPKEDDAARPGSSDKSDSLDK